MQRNCMKVSIVVGVPPNGWFIIENVIKMDDLGVPLFKEASTCLGRVYATLMTLIKDSKLFDFPLVVAGGRK